VLSVEELNARLNPRGLPVYEASATQGNGVFDTLKLIIKLVLDKAKSTGASAATKAPAASAPPPPSDPAPYPADGMERIPAEPQSIPAAAAQSTSGSQPTAVAAEPSVPTPTPVAPVPEPVVATAQPETRPYPGSQSPLSNERKAPTGSYGSQSEELSADSLGKNISADSRKDTADDSAGMNRPQMAPSLRRRGGTRKRGFFKRLFGIK
jgi:hypothetical protein